MAEQKDVHSSPTERAPKLQLALDQPSTGGHWDPPKEDTPCSKTKKKPHTVETSWVHSVVCEDTWRQDCVWGLADWFSTHKIIQWGKNSLFNKWSCDNCVVHTK